MFEPVILCSVYFLLCYCLAVSNSAVDCVERFVSEVTCCVSSGTLNPTHSVSSKFTLSWLCCVVLLYM